MSGSLIDLLRQQIEDLHVNMTAIEERAAAEGRSELTDHEQAAWDKARAEAAAKNDRLSSLIGRHELDAQAGLLMARMGGGAGTEGTPARIAGGSPFPYRTPGEYALAYMRMKHGDSAEGARFTRALADVVSAGTPGLVPPQVTGDVLGLWLANRPAVDAMTKPELPPVGMEVQRPHISQHTDVGPHTEKGPVASQAFTLDLTKIPLHSYAGGVDVSWELANRSSPAALDVIFQDLVSVYARKSDAAAWGGVAANVTATVPWDGTAATLATAITAAAILIAQNSEETVFPDTAWLGLNAYAALAGLSDTTGRPLFPDLAPANALGTADAGGNVSAVMGLRAVVDPLIDPDTFVVGNSEEVEFYETPGAPVQLSVVDVGVAGYNVGVIGMFACAAVDPGAFCTITLAGATGAGRAGAARK
jgi:HK97 family phage major capsid protein